MRIQIVVIAALTAGMILWADDTRFASGQSPSPGSPRPGLDRPLPSSDRQQKLHADEPAVIAPRAEVRIHQTPKPQPDHVQQDSTVSEQVQLIRANSLRILPTESGSTEEQIEVIERNSDIARKGVIAPNDSRRSIAGMIQRAGGFAEPADSADRSFDSKARSFPALTLSASNTTRDANESLPSVDGDTLVVPKRRRTVNIADEPFASSARAPVIPAIIAVKRKPAQKTNTAAGTQVISRRHAGPSALPSAQISVGSSPAVGAAVGAAVGTVQWKQQTRSVAATPPEIRRPSLRAIPVVSSQTTMRPDREPESSSKPSPEIAGRNIISVPHPSDGLKEIREQPKLKRFEFSKSKSKPEGTVASAFRADRKTSREDARVAPDSVPDSLRPVSKKRAAVLAPAPVGSIPHALRAKVVAVPYQPHETNPKGIGTSKTIGKAVAAEERATTADQPQPIRPGHRTKVVQVSHLQEAPSKQSSRCVVPPVTDLEVGFLPNETDDQAAGEIVQAAADGVIEIPLQPVPSTDNASIEATNDLVTLVATDADLRGVLRMIADHHQLNLVIGPDVTGPTTVSIRGAHLDEVLDAILGVAGYHWNRVGNLLYVTGSDAASLDPRVQGRRLQVYPLNYVAAEDVHEVVKGLLSPLGQVFVSEADDADQLKTRELLIVEDNESGHGRVSQYLAQVDLQPAQVLVEAHILQVDLDDDHRHGINLRGFANSAGAQIPHKFNHIGSHDPLGPSVSMQVDGKHVCALLHAIKSKTTARTLASPKVSVVNRQTAKIQIGQRLPYPVATTTQTATTQNVEFLDVGIVLNVTPVITDDGNVLMTVLPKVSGGTIAENGLPAEDTTEVNTTVLMPDGGGLVIGGLIRETCIDAKARATGLGSVPVINRLFGKTQKTGRCNELVIALVTHIIRDCQPPRMQELTNLQDALPACVESELRYQPHVTELNEIEYASP